MFQNNPFIGIPIGSACCFLFLFFSFLNTPRSKQVRYFRLMLIACLMWMGGAVLMRAQISPGVDFWFNISLLGLLTMPICMYFFLFHILDIDKSRFLVVCLTVTWGLMAVNSIWENVVAPPQVIARADGNTVYTYAMSPGALLLSVAELVLLVYVTTLAHFRINGDKMLRKKLFPLLLGTIFILGGSFLEFIPGNVFPFGAMGGVLMSICLVYIMYKQYMFDLSHRITIGCIYSVAAVLVMLVFSNLVGNIDYYTEGMELDKETELVLIAGLLTAWTLIMIGLARYLAERVLQKKKKEQFETLQSFQTDTASLFSEEELYQKIVDAVKKLLKGAEAVVYVKKEGEKDYEPVQISNENAMPDEEERKRIVNLLDAPNLKEHMEIALLKYDKKIQGFIYLKIPPHMRMDYTEVECYHQIGIYASICLKNISIYQEVYQVSIHDELTGTYNRSHFQEFVNKHWAKEKEQAFLYLDVDDFKLFNELYGGACGDEILKWCGKMIQRTVGNQGAVFRFGSNEFLVYTGYGKKEECLRLAEQIQENAAGSDDEKPRVLQPITFSMGIAIFPDTAANADELLKQAERATFFAKKNGKNRVEIYEVDTEIAKEKDDSPGSYEQVAPTIYALTAAIDAKDSYTFEHSCHVSEYAVLLAKEIGLKKEEIQIVKEAGLLHDIGKIGIPENILKKQGKLTEEEYKVITTHVLNSIEMIHFLPNMSYVIPAVISHHERYDGKGYPRGISGKQIPLLGRILTVCDCFDAITSKRSYKDAMPMEYAKEELEKNKGTQFDPDLTDAFIKLIEEGKIALANAN